MTLSSLLFLVYGTVVLAEENDYDFLISANYGVHIDEPKFRHMIVAEYSTCTMSLECGEGRFCTGVLTTTGGNVSLPFSMYHMFALPRKLRRRVRAEVTAVDDAAAKAAHAMELDKKHKIDESNRKTDENKSNERRMLDDTKMINARAMNLRYSRSRERVNGARDEVGARGGDMDGARCADRDGARGGDRDGARGGDRDRARGGDRDGAGAYDEGGDEDVGSGGKEEEEVKAGDQADDGDSDDGQGENGDDGESDDDGKGEEYLGPGGYLKHTPTMYKRLLELVKESLDVLEGEKSAKEFVRFVTKHLPIDGSSDCSSLQYSIEHEEFACFDLNYCCREKVNQLSFNR